MQTQSPTTAPRRQPSNGIRRSLRRTTDDRVLAGVAGGLAEQLRVDAVVVRITFVLTASVWGLGLVAYLALWLVVPEVDRPSTNIVRPGQRPTRFRAASLAAIVLGSVILMRGWGWLPPDKYLLPWAFITVGVVVLWGRNPIRPLPRPALMPGPPNTLLTDIDFALDDSTDVPDTDPVAEPVTSAESAESEVTAKHSRRATPAQVPIGTLTGGALLVACGLLYLGDDTGLLDVSWRLTGGVALTVIGIALIAGGWWGRPRGLIIVGGALSLFLLVATVLQVPLRGGVGRRDLRPVSIEEVEDNYRLAAGVFFLDLRDVEPPDRRTVAVTVAAGELRVMVPLGVEVVVDARVGFGEVVVFDRSGNGVGVRRSFSSSGSSPGLWVLDLDVGVGKLLVEQVP
jgi:phage shock protein PspC (stress-responsive transcriptional regulator)